MPDTGNANDCHTQIFTLKNVTWRTQLISFTVQCCFLFRFVSIELVSLISVLQIWVAIYVYGIMINWSSLIKKLMQTYIVIVSGSIQNISTVHLNGIWHLIWRYLSKPVLGGHPVLSRHYSIPWGCPLNTGFTVILGLQYLPIKEGTRGLQLGAGWRTCSSSILQYSSQKSWFTLTPNRAFPSTISDLGISHTSTTKEGTALNIISILLDYKLLTFASEYFRGVSHGGGYSNI